VDDVRLTYSEQRALRAIAKFTDEDPTIQISSRGIQQVVCDALGVDAEGAWRLISSLYEKGMLGYSPEEAGKS
jgi:hypothetical protein